MIIQFSPLYCYYVHFSSNIVYIVVYSSDVVALLGYPVCASKKKYIII